MKANLFVIILVLCGSLAEARTNEFPTFTISAEDVIQSSNLKHPTDARNGTNRFTVKFQYTESGSNRARAFTETHQGQTVREKIGEFETPPSILSFTNTSGRDGYWSIPEKDANAIVEGLKKK
jgi:hypothetical protein